MKKTGFSLSEILIVLGVIGVVAALTLPSLMSDTAAAQIGPKLAKSVSMFDQASSALLSEKGVDNVLDSELLNDTSYAEELTKHLKATADTSLDVSASGGHCGGAGNFIGTLLAKDGVVYSLYWDTNVTTSDGTPAHKQRIGYVLIDLNGPAEPDEPGTDQFQFIWFADGSLKPAGGTGSGSECNWVTSCPKGENENELGKPEGEGYWACAGHVFENSFRVLYQSK